MRDRRSELKGALVFLALIVAGFAWTGRIDLTFSSELETVTGPRGYPRMVLSFMLLFNLAVILRALVDRREPSPDGAVPADRGGEVRSSGRTLATGAVFAALVVFVVLFERLGYLLTMFPLLLFTAVLAGARSRARAAVISLALTMLCLVVFRYGLSTVLPEGVLGIDMLF